MGTLQYISLPGYPMTDNNPRKARGWQVDRMQWETKERHNGANISQVITLDGSREVKTRNQLWLPEFG